MVSGFSSSIYTYAYSGNEVFANDKVDPYISTKSVEEIAELNGKVEVSGRIIDCRHLSTLFVLNAIGCYSKGKKIKVSELFQSKDSIAKVTPDNIEELYENTFEKSCARHIIACDNFGVFLYKVAIKMNYSEQRFFFLHSSSHVMSFIVSRKIRKERTFGSWVVNFFDPNKTNVTSRSEVYDPRDFLNVRRFSLKMFIGKFFYESYFFSPTGHFKERECAIYEYSYKKSADFKFSTLETLSQYGISGCMVYHIMHDELGSFCLRDIAKRIDLSVLDREAVKEIFYAKNTRGSPALYTSMYDGKSQSVASYGYLLEKLSCLEQVNVDLVSELLTAKNSSGVPPLFIAMQAGQSECIDQFGVLLENHLIPMKSAMSIDDFSNILFDVLLSKRDDGLPALFIALYTGKSNAITAYSKLLDNIFILRDHISDAKLVLMLYKIISSTDGHNTHSLFMAMQEGNSSAVLSFAVMIDKLLVMKGRISDVELADMAFRLLISKGGDNIPGLFMAMQEGHVSTVRAFCKLLEKFIMFKGCIESNHFDYMLTELITSRRPDGTTGLSIALTKNLCDVVDIYSLLLKKIPESALVNVLVAPDNNGIPSILVAGEDAAESYFTMLNSLPVSVIKDLRLLINETKKSIPTLFLSNADLNANYRQVLARLNLFEEQAAGSICNIRCTLM